MFFVKGKLSSELKLLLKNNYYKNIRVLIFYSNLDKSLEKKILSYHCKIYLNDKFLNVLSVDASQYAINRLRELPYVKYICSDIQCHLSASNTISANGMSLSTKLPGSGKGLTIGIIDSGVYPHNDLKKPFNKIQGFVDFYSDITEPYDDNGHGTFISGIICGSGLSGNGLYRGVARDSNIVMFKTFDKYGRCYCGDILNALNYISNMEDHKINILLLPFEVDIPNDRITELFNKYFEEISKQNICIIVPSGNKENVEGRIYGFALLENCFTVGGLDNSLSVPMPCEDSSGGSFSKIKKPDLIAAAKNITSLNCDTKYISMKNGKKIYPRKLDESYTTASGTSISAAFIAGICASILEYDPSLKPNDIYSLLRFCTNKLECNRYKQGFGTLSLKKLNKRISQLKR